MTSSEGLRGQYEAGREGSCHKNSRSQAGGMAGAGGDLASRHFGQYCLLEDTPGCQVIMLKNSSEFGPYFRKMFPNGS